jgi:hypothetical protein
MAACVDALMEMKMKPFELCRLICAELSLESSDDQKPKEIVALANQKLNREPALSSSSGETMTVKEEAQAVRQAIRDRPPSFWGEQKVAGNSSPEAFVTRLLLKPPSAGGFCSAVAIKRLKNKCIDMKTCFSHGALTIDGFPVLPSPGQYSTLDNEIKSVTLLFSTKRPSTKFSHCVFMVSSREQLGGGASLLWCKANKCSARFVSLLTPKFCLVAFYNHAGPESEAKTLGLFEEVRLEAGGASR